MHLVILTSVGITASNIALYPRKIKMELAIPTSNQEVQMSSLDFLNDYINPARLEAGESIHENRKFIRKIEDEIEDLGDRKIIPHPQNHKDIVTYDLNYDQMMLVGMRESKAVRKTVLAKLKQLQQPKTLPVMTEIEMIAAVASNLVKQQKAIEQTQSDVSALGSDVADIKSKVSKIQDLSDQLKFGYITLKDGWSKHCNVCSYEVFREFASNLGLPLEEFTHVPDHTVVVVKTHQVKITDLTKLRDHIVKYAKQESKTLWSHPDLNHRFSLRG